MPATAPRTEDIFLVKLNNRETGTQVSLPANTEPRLSFFQQVAMTYKKWLDQGHDPDRELFPKPGPYGTPLEQNVALLVRQLSILGLKPVDQGIAEPVVLNALKKRRDELAANYQKLVQVFLAYQLFCESIVGTGLVFPKHFDLNKLYFVPQERIARIRGNNDDLALTLSDGEILMSREIPTDEILDVALHEFGHQVRFTNKKDDLLKQGDKNLEEGIVQHHADVVMQTSRLVCKRTGNVYSSETWFARQLGKIFGEKDLIGTGQEEIRRMVNKRYASTGIIGEPFNEMMYDLHRLVETERSIVEKLDTSNIAPGQKEALVREYQNIKRQIAQMWEFDQN